MADAVQTPLLALALDMDDLVAARKLAREVQPYFKVAKVGLELFSAAGARAVEQLTDDGFDVFLDVKLHDIPTTVEKASAVLGRLGARYLTLHTSGGEAMLRAGVAGLLSGSQAAGLSVPMALGVTVLTSDATADKKTLETRALLAKSGGCGGLVCAAPDLSIIHPLVPDLLAVVPGTRSKGASLDDQGRVATPEQAVAEGAAMLVIGRQVTNALDPVLAAQELVASLQLPVP